MAAVQIYTENYARGTGSSEEKLNSSRVFFSSLVVDSTSSVLIVFTMESKASTKGAKNTFKNYS